MKVIGTFFLLLLLLLSCQSKEDEASPTSIPGKWQLTQVRADWTFVAGVTDSLPYQETIDFHSNNTFEQSRSDGLVATGTYSILPVDGYQIVELTYDNNYPSLSETNKAYLTKIENNQLVASYVFQDSPLHYYQKVRKK